MMETEGLGLWANVFKTYYKSIIVFLVLGIIVSLLETMYIMKPAYVAEATILFTSSDNARETTASELQAMSTYTDLLNSDMMASRVVQQDGLNVSPWVVRGETSIGTNPSSLVVAIDTKDSSAEMAIKIANGYADVAQSFLPTLMSGSSITVVDHAQGAVSVKPARKTYIMLGAILGIVIGVVLAFVRYSFSVNRKTKKRNAVHLEKGAATSRQ